MTKPIFHHLERAVLAACAILAASGCASYQIGARSMFRPDIQTVHVPVFESDPFRRFLGERLTEAVVKEIESTTPYKVTRSATADSVLTGRIVAMQKRVIVVNRNDEPRDLEVDFHVEVTWIDRRGVALMSPVIIPLDQLAFTLNQNASFVPEGGQSMATAQLEATRKLARQIRAQMETPW